MAVGEIILSIVETAMSWMFLAVFILILVKLFQLVSSLWSGGKGGGGWDWFGNGEEDEGEGNNGSAKSDMEKAIDNPGYLRVRVRTLDDEPVKGVNVQVKPLKWKHRLKRFRNYYNGNTNTDGLWPSTGGFRVIPSVPLKITVKYSLEQGKNNDQKYRLDPNARGAKGLTTSGKKKKGKIKMSDTIEVVPGQERTHTINLPIRGEYPYEYEPVIHKPTRLEGDNLITRGEVR